MAHELLNPPGVHPPQAHYSHVARAGNTLFIAGQLAINPAGAVVGVGDGARVGEIDGEEVEPGLPQMVVRVVEPGNDGQAGQVVLDGAGAGQRTDRLRVTDRDDASVLHRDRLRQRRGGVHRPDPRVEEDLIRNVPRMDTRHRRGQRRPGSSSDRDVREPGERQPRQERSRLQ